MTIGLGHYLAVGAILFTLGILGIFLNRKTIIVILMSIELILLAVNVKRQDINVQNARTPELAMSVRKVASGQGLQDADAAEWVK